MDAMQNLVSVRREGRIATLVLERPEVHNALNWAMVEQLSRACADLDADSGVHVVVITGRGRSFCSGMDRSEPAVADLHRLVLEGFGDREALYRLRKPTVGALAGAVLGAGFELALSADMLLADDTVSFAFPEIAMSGMPGAGGTLRLAARLGVDRAMELCMTGRKLGAEEALAHGLVMAVHRPEDLLPQAMALAARIADQALAPLMLIKQAVRSASQAALATSMPLETLSSYACILGRAIPPPGDPS